MSDTEPKTRRAVSPKSVFAALLGALAVAFAFQNTEDGQVQVLFWELTLPAWVWLLSVFVVGIIVGSVFPWGRRGKRK